ncbi:FHA domain-containing protein [Niallia sp. XMNu-256]|uniref:FHA domain-containing protein n=1 Tax=Niallia sp. XMNu-256 TaxID=3082444 RepID=UPI0030D0CFDD
MGITTVEQRKNKYIIMNKLAKPELINEREFKVVADGLVESFIPLKTEKKRTGVVIKSTVVGMISLQSYFREVVSKHMFLDIVSQLIAIVKECERNLMNVNNLMLDDEYIFIDATTQKVKCIFWPIFNNEHVYEASQFFNELPFRTIFSKDENHDYITDYLHYFKSHSSFTIKSFEKLINDLSGKKTTNHSHPLTGSTQFGESQRISNKPKGDTGTTDSSQKSCPQCGQETPLTAKYCSSCGTPLYPVEEFKSQFLNISEVLGIVDSEEETTVLGKGAFAGGTTVLGADLFEEPAFPYLIREKTQEKITVDKPSFRIGKEKSFCDYFVANNNAVSRSHADIITKDGRYFIIDNNSTNKTYVDERAIPVQQEVEIFSGTKLRLANEEFVFYI